MREGQAGSSGQPTTSFPAASLQNGSSRPGPRSVAKPVLALPAAVVGLVSALHGEYLLLGDPRGWSDHRLVPVTTGSITGHPSGSRRRQPTIRLYPAICKGASASGARVRESSEHRETRGRREREENPCGADRRHLPCEQPHVSKKGPSICGFVHAQGVHPGATGRFSHSRPSGPAAYYWKRTHKTTDSTRCKPGCTNGDGTGLRSPRMSRVSRTGVRGCLRDRPYPQPGISMWINNPLTGGRAHTE